MDERAQQIGTRAITTTLAIVYVFWLGVVFSKLIGTRRIETAVTEIVFLVLTLFVLLWFVHQDGRLLPSRLHEHADFEELLRSRHVLRRTRRYALGVLGFSTFLTIVDHLVEHLTGDIMTLLPLATWQVWALQIGCVFSAFLIIDTLWNKLATRCYIRKIKELGDHEQTR